ncbi:DNA translocase FtsK [Gayadomonas joobiniege]|uniref:DNA translocase FtsK n=1 Tax=Gayadomonas joobiniege TaxID=1234606 RepID=UPI000380449B|nr:DNA translocase FtsK [Gayadomonas joobiniege]
MILQQTTKVGHLSGIQRLLEAGLLGFAAVAIFTLLALISFDPMDPGWSQTGQHQDIQNMAGSAGAWLSDILLFFFGAIAYVVPFTLIYAGWLIFRHQMSFFTTDFLALGLRLIGLILLVTSTTSLASMNFNDYFVYSAGGFLGDVISYAMLPYFNFIGTTLVLLSFFCTGVTLFFGLSWLYLIDKTGEYLIKSCCYIYQKIASVFKRSETTEGKNSNSPNEITESSVQDEQQAPKQLSGRSTAQRTEKELEVDKSRPEKTTESKSHDAASSLKMLFAKKEPMNEQPAVQPPGMAAEDKKEPVINEAALNDIPELDDDGMQSQLPLSSSPSPAAKTNAAESDEKTSAAHSEPEVPKKAAMRMSDKQTSYAEFMQNVEQEQAAEQAKKEQAQLTPLPSFDLLDRADKKENPITQEEMDSVARLVESKLADFGVDARVVGMYPGPVITRLELDLAPGVKVSKITNLSKDIARSLSAMSVRVVEVIPGKSYVGLELPNKHREVVSLSEVISGPSFADGKSPLTMVLGQDIAGEPVVVDLAKMPHLLVAGTTGSGKSVGVNVMILSLLYKSTPDEVRLIMIDPKMLELSVYEGIPHLLCEVVTDMKEASNALRWCVGEMERRYKLMSAMGVRNVKGFNAKIDEARAKGQPYQDPLWKPGDSMDEEAPELEKLPSIVVVIDEFADMMMIVGKKVEELIARIAQKARAAGIHLILATQRPSVDVITGLIKANIPTRIAFQVSSKIDSRTILDQQGAETLLGMGDMLYLPAGKGVPTRVHGAFVDDHEVHAVVADWKARGTPVYIDEILNGDASEDVLLPGEQAEIAADEEADPIYDEAVAFVTETRKVSVSSVQRKFRIGYNRAARIVEQMEASGVVSTAAHNGSREVLAAAPPRDD